MISGIAVATASIHEFRDAASALRLTLALAVVLMLVRLRADLLYAARLGDRIQDLGLTESGTEPAGLIGLDERLANLASEPGFPDNPDRWPSRLAEALFVGGEDTGASRSILAGVVVALAAAVVAWRLADDGSESAARWRVLVVVSSLVATTVVVLLGALTFAGTQVWVPADWHAGVLIGATGLVLAIAVQPPLAPGQTSWGRKIVGRLTPSRSR